MRVWVLVLVVALGLGYWFWPKSEGEAEASADGSSVPASSPSENPPSEGSGNPGTPPDPGTQEDDGPPSLKMETPGADSPRHDALTQSPPTSDVRQPTVAKGVQEIVAKARALESQGDSAGAAEALRGFLDASNGAHGYGPAYLQLVRLTPEDRDEEKRLLLSRALDSGGLGSTESDVCYQALSRLNDRLIFSKRAFSGSIKYEIVPNDSLWAICRKMRRQGYLITESMLQKVNRMGDSTVIHPGKKLKVLTEPMRIVVEKRKYRLRLYLGDCILRQYNVGLGKGDSTPEGRFTIESKLEEPTWIFDGRRIPFGHADHVLGTRWLGFNNTDEAEGFGIHGTVDPDSIGKDRSNGCVRLVNSDVEEIFQLVPRGVTVEIRL